MSFCFRASFEDGGDKTGNPALSLVPGEMGWTETSLELLTPPHYGEEGKGDQAPQVLQWKAHPWEINWKFPLLMRSEQWTLRLGTGQASVHLLQHPKYLFCPYHNRHLIILLSIFTGHTENWISFNFISVCVIGKIQITHQLHRL